MVCAAGPRRRLRICRRRTQRQHGLPDDAAADRAEALRRHYQLRLRQRRRHLRTCVIHRRDGRRHSWHSSSSSVPCLYCDCGCLRVGWHGRRLRRNRSRTNDLSIDDLRDDAGLRRHRAADDREHDQPLRSVATTARAHLRGPRRAGRHPSAHQWRPTSGSAPGREGDAACKPDARRRDHCTGGA